MRYALAVARCAHDDDWRLQQLGRIHLIKYVYLADLASAEREGTSFTGTPWTFYRFGPWESRVNERVEPALDVPGVEHRTIQSAYSDEDYERWCIPVRRDAEELRDRTESELPFGVAARVRRAVEEYGSATPDLLHHVYESRPMLNAAPDQALDLALAAEPETNYGAPSPDRSSSLRPKALKRRKQALDEARVRIRERARQLKEEAAARARATPRPRYDDLFREGLAALEQQAGPSLETEGEIEFGEAVWHAPARTLETDD